jgi:DNA-binding CsgD family transcriptional regulator
MALRTTETLLTALGFSRQTSRLYERMQSLAGRSLADVLEAMAYDAADIEPYLRPLIDAGIVREEDGVVIVLAPAEAVSIVLADAARNAARNTELLEQVARALPHLAGSTVRLAETAAEELPLDGELLTVPYRPGALDAMAASSGGDLLWLRPDQWSTPWEERTLDLIADVVARGRRARSIYPVRVLTEAPAVIMRRIEVGEEIRFLDHVPTRMLVMGSTHAILPEPIGYVEAPRLMLRQRGIVEALIMLFDELWQRAEPYDPAAGVLPDVNRRFLLQQLATGAQDEQIARRLGVSLRTVRRRVADLLDELGVESRFAAGVEATRRGWL